MPRTDSELLNRMSTFEVEQSEVNASRDDAD